MTYLRTLPKTKIPNIPVGVSECLLGHREIIVTTRAQCRGTFIEYYSKTRCLMVGGSPEKRQKALMLIYDKLERRGIRFNNLWKAANNEGRGSEEDASQSGQ